MRNLFSRLAPHELADPAQRAAGVATLDPGAPELSKLLVEDPAPQVRAAVARHMTDHAALQAAWQREPDAAVRGAIAAALFGTAHCSDEMRAEIARHGADPQQRHAAIQAIQSEAVLVSLALDAQFSETRKAAAERVTGADGLRKLAEEASNTDRGVARIARQKLHTFEDQARLGAAADELIARAEALASKPGEILASVLELEQRWGSLQIAEDMPHAMRYAAARQALQPRCDQEQQERRERARFNDSWQQWIEALAPPASLDELAAKRTELAALRDEAQARAALLALDALGAAGQRLDAWQTDLQAQADAQSRVIAEQQAGQAEREHAATDAARQQQTAAARQAIHVALHAAERALAEGQLHVARAGANEIKPLRPLAGLLPQPTIKRIGQLMQKLGEMERWESFGQQSAREQLCERAEALAAAQAVAPPSDPVKTAQEVQKLRDEWKALDQQHAGKIKVPQSLWSRFDGACTKAYAPAARYFAERTAQRKLAREQRELFITEQATQVSALLAAEPRDWRGIERWLRDIDQKWRGADLGGVEPKLRKKLDAKLREAIAPLRAALGAHHSTGKAGREALIAEAKALVDAGGRDAMTKLKDIQARWQAHAKANAIAHRDERALWDQFRAVGDAIVSARNAERKKEDEHKHEGRRALDALCAELEALAQPGDSPDATVRGALRELDGRWHQARRAMRSGDPALLRLESRFKSGKSAVEAMLRERERGRTAGLWQALLAKEKLCEALDRHIADGAAGDALDTQSAWAAQPPLPAAWENKLAARRDAALNALADPDAREEYLAQIEQDTEQRRAELLQLELALGIDPPQQYQAARRALQLQQLKERFSSGAAPAANNANASERLLAWCALPGVLETVDRERADRIFAAIARRAP